jgi:hypothetical protein
MAHIGHTTVRSAISMNSHRILRSTISRALALRPSARPEMADFRHFCRLNRISIAINVPVVLPGADLDAPLLPHRQQNLRRPCATSAACSGRPAIVERTFIRGVTRVRGAAGRSSGSDL